MPQGIERLVALGATGAASLPQFVDGLKPPRVVWLMVPAAAVDDLLATLTPLLQAGDIVLDGGNSHHHDDLRRAAALAASSIDHVDVGTSGGVAGLERGYCLMIGGSDEAVQHLAPLFVTLAPGAGKVGSRGNADFANRVQSAMRHEFGGHVEKPVDGPQARG